MYVCICGVVVHLIYSRNFDYGKRTDQNFIIQSLCHVKDCRIFEKKGKC